MTELVRYSTSIGYLRVAVVSTRGHRDTNEDAVGITGWCVVGQTRYSKNVSTALRPLEVSLPLSELPVLIALTDGLGGVPGGGKASRIAAEVLTNSGPITRFGERSANEAFAAAHREIHAASTEDTTGMGCTAALLAVHPDGATLVANVGDVRAYRILDGYAGQLTEDDRSTDDVTGMGTVVTRSVGGRREEPAAPHTFGFRLGAGQRVILCSDGIYDSISMTDPELTLGDSTPASAANRILRAAMVSERYSRDNATVVVVDARPSRR